MYIQDTKEESMNPHKEILIFKFSIKIKEYEKILLEVQVLLEEALAMLKDE